ncbi:MAG: hypothetical protein ACHQQ3_08045 [Gemmatimonadales bacterium]
MENEDERRLYSIRRCDDFMREHQFPGPAIQAAARRLAASRAALDVLVRREHSAKGTLPNDGRLIRTRVRSLRTGFLSPIAKAARAVEGFVEHTPGAARALKVPHPKDSPALHVEAGDRFAEFLKQHRTAFLRETGFDRDTLSKLRAATDELRRQAGFAHSTRRERSGLLREIKRHLSAGRRQVDVLKVLLEPIVIERDLVHLWAMANRVGPRIGRPKDTPAQRAEKRAHAAERKAERRARKREEVEQQRQARRERRLRSKQGGAPRRGKPPHAG